MEVLLSKHMKKERKQQHQQQHQPNGKSARNQELLKLVKLLPDDLYRTVMRGAKMKNR